MANVRYPVLFLLIISGAASLARAGDTPDTKKILKAADDATKALKSVTYEAEFRGEGANKDRAPHVQGKVKAKRAKRGMLSGIVGARDMWSFEGVATMSGSSDEEHFKIATDGKHIYKLDDQDKVLIKGELPQAQRLSNPGRLLTMLEYVHPTPFSDELGAESATHEGVKPVGDEKCDVIYVVYSGNQGQARWYFSQKDHLPRRVERIVKEDGVEGSTVLSVTNLVADPELDKADFAIKTPEGYEEKTFEAPRNPEAPELLRVRSKAPEWELKTAGGEKVALSSLRGNVVVLAFWATHSGPSKLTMPTLQKAHEQFKGKPVKIIAVSCWEGKGKDPAAYIKKKKYSFDLLVEGDKVADDYKLNNLPTLYVINQDGKIAYAAEGVLKGGDEELAKIIKKSMKSTED